MKKNLITILCVLSVVGLSACAPKEPTTTTEATTAEAKGEVLTGTAKGYGGDVTVKVTMDGDKIIDVTVEGPDETDGVGTLALEQLPDLIKVAGNTKVDAIAGATVTSDAIIAAINNAINPSSTGGEEVNEEVYTRKEIAMTDDSLKTGFASVVAIDKSTDAGAEEGVARTNAVLAAVTVDNKGIITDCVIDSVDADIKFTAEGKISTDGVLTGIHFLTMNERAIADKNESIDADWATFSATIKETIIGKDLAGLKAIAADDTNADVLKAIITATETAKSYGAKAGDKLALGITTDCFLEPGSHTIDATADKAGLAEAASTIAVVTLDASGKVSSCILDSFQSKVQFDTSGVISSDIKESVKTKLELGDDYGMRKASGIKREWFEQASALADYAAGKDFEAIVGIGLDDDGKPTDVDVVSSVTMGVDVMKEMIIVAIDRAK